MKDSKSIKSRQCRNLFMKHAATLGDNRTDSQPPDNSAECTYIKK